jgi:hypothetical protein
MRSQTYNPILKYYFISWFLQANTGRWDRAVHSLRTGRFWIRSPGGTGNLCALGDVQTRPTANPSSYSKCSARLTLQEESGRGKRRTTVVARVNNEWKYPSNPYTHTFMACKGTTLCLPFPEKYCEVSKFMSLKLTIFKSSSINVSQLPQLINQSLDTMYVTRFKRVVT